MPDHINSSCPHCQQPVAIPVRTVPGSQVRCPRCQQVFPWTMAEAATRSLEAAPQVTATLPPAAAGAARESGPGPQKIGRFAIRRVLGEGGFGIVYEAHDPQLDRAIALKVAKLGGDSEQRVKRFLREAKSAANLRHPHIVPLYEFGQDGDQFYLALAYIPGQSLDHVIGAPNEKQERMECRRAVMLVRYLAEALAYAHGLGIVHRDIKPHNVMLDERGEPLLMDFGLAARDEDEKLTREGAIMGTAAYMAPEQYRGQPTAASDQYSLGVTLYELLTGETPFAGPPDVQVYHLVYTEPESPRKRNREVPRDLETICLKCLEKDAGKRYADCRALADECRRWLDGEPILARPVGVVERLWRWGRRKPALAAASAAAVCGVLLALVTFVVAFFVVSESRDKAINLAGEKADLATLEHKQRVKAENLAEEKRLLAEKETKARKEAETLLVQVKFEHAFQQPEEKRAFGILSTANLLRDVIALENQPLQDTFRLHLGSWFQQSHRLICIFSHKDSVTASAFSPDGKTVLTGSSDKTARLWETATGKPLGLPMQHQDSVIAVAFSPDGKTVLTGSSDKTARLWDTATGKALGLPLQHQDRVIAVAFSPGGKSVLTGSDDHTARLWETATGKPLGPPLLHHRGVGSVAFSPDGKTVLTGSVDCTARLWRAPRLIDGDAERILLWAQVITGSELDEYGVTRVLDAATWEQRRQRLQELGGPPAE